MSARETVLLVERRRGDDPSLLDVVTGNYRPVVSAQLQRSSIEYSSMTYYEGLLVTKLNMWLKESPTLDRSFGFSTISVGISGVRVGIARISLGQVSRQNWNNIKTSYKVTHEQWVDGF